MNGYQPEKRCSNCLAFNICKKKHKNQVCKKCKECRPAPPSPNAHLYAQTQTPTYTPPPMPEVKAPKQRTVLSVRDIAILYYLVSDNMTKIEHQAQFFSSWECADGCIEGKEANIESLHNNLYYQDLLRIRNKLGELNIEVETPIVEVEE